MKINPDKCVACGNCTYVCPMGAIYIDPAIKRATVNLTECVECYACFNGLSQEQIQEVLLQVAVYAGVPAANRAFAVAQRVLSEAGASE